MWRALGNLGSQLLGAWPRVRCFFVFFLLCMAAARAAEPIDAQQLAQDFPPGSITTKEAAERALSEATSLHSRLQREFDAQRSHCEHVFFVNRCLGAARQAQREGERVVRRVTLEAHDLQRHLDARARAERRAADLRRQAAEDLQRPERERQAMQAARTRQENAEARAQDALRREQAAAQHELANEQRLRQQEADLARKDALRPQQEAASLRQFQQKQEQAAAYAQTRARDREANAKRRAERQAARDQQSGAAPVSP